MKYSSLLAIDLRSLALFRIAIALFILIDLAFRALDLPMFYTDSGVLPRAALLASGQLHPWLASLHLLGGTWGWQALLFAIAAIFAVMLLIGWRTRLATIGSWLMLMSLHHRFPALQQGGDYLLRLLLFWAMFVPLGARWSWDRRGQNDPMPTSVVSIGTAALLLQAALIYVFAAATKSKDVWFWQGTGIYYALNLDGFARPLGVWLRQYLVPMQWLSRAVFLLQAVGPWLLFSPVWTGPVRTVLVFVFIAWHLGMNLTMALGPFPWVGSASLLLFLPTWFWEQIGRLLPRLRSLPGEGQARARPPGWAQAVALLALVIILWSNIAVLRPDRPMPAWLHQIGLVTQLNQGWNMFAAPFIWDGWYVMPGQLANGRQVDVWRPGQILDWDKPSGIAREYSNERWRKLMMILWQDGFVYLRAPLASNLCRRWNGQHPGDERLVNLEIWFVREDTLSLGSAAPYPSLVWKQTC